MLCLRRYKPESLVNEWMHASLCVVICLLSLVTGSWFQETDIAVEFFKCTFGTLSTASQVPSSSIIVIVYILEKRQTSLWPTSPKLSSRHKNNPDRFSTTDVSGNYLLNILQNNSAMQSWNHNLIWLIFFFFFARLSFSATLNSKAVGWVTFPHLPNPKVNQGNCSHLCDWKILVSPTAGKHIPKPLLIDPSTPQDVG